MFGWLKRRTAEAEPVETRASGSGFTSEVIAARWSYISGSRGLAELTATASGCVSLWEGALASADVAGAEVLDRRSMALLARSAALRGEAVFLIGDRRLVPATDWDISTRDGEPRAYRLSIPEVGGGTTRTALAAEVLHVRIGADPAAPWTGVSPLRRASLTAALLSALESALGEAFENMPLGSQIVPFPEAPGVDMETLGRGFRGSRGRVLLRESVQASAAGVPAPAQDWKPSDVTPDLSRAMTRETLDAARHGILGAFGVLPAMFNPSTTGPMVREGQRHLATWTLQPLAELIAEEASAKLGQPVKIDTLRPLQAYDAGGRARAVSAVIGALATAKAAGIEAGDVERVMQLVDWKGETP